MNKLVEFFSEVRKEASKVTWPTRRETMITSMLVLVLSGLAGVFFLIVDGALAYLTRWLINIRF
jgi:preprotein translocase subunit SecE